MSKHAKYCCICEEELDERRDVDAGGHCYMFKDKPDGVCAQFKENI
jgi:hypothetical protein